MTTYVRIRDRTRIKLPPFPDCERWVERIILWGMVGFFVWWAL